MVIEHFLALGDARSPRCLVASLRCASDSGSVASAANLLERLFAGIRRGGTATGATRTGSARVRLDGESGVIRPSDRFLGDGLKMSFNALQILALVQHLLVLRLTGDHTRQRKNSDGDHDQQTDDHAEGIKEMGVLLAHVWIRVERLINRRRSIDHPGRLRLSPWNAVQSAASMCRSSSTDDAWTAPCPSPWAPFPTAPKRCHTRLRSSAALACGKRLPGLSGCESL